MYMGVELNTKAKWLATWMGLGLSPKAPGTVGTLGAIPFAVVAVYALGQSAAYLLFVFAFFLFGTYICHLTEKSNLRHDSSEIVIDEVAGYLLAVTWLPNTWQTYVYAFVLFRVFDIIKPPPIRQIDKKIGGGFGVMADDMAAGIAANLVLQWLYYSTSVLGMQWPQM